MRVMDEGFYEESMESSPEFAIDDFAVDEALGADGALSKRLCAVLETDLESDQERSPDKESGDASPRRSGPRMKYDNDKENIAAERNFLAQPGSSRQCTYFNKKRQPNTCPLTLPFMYSKKLRLDQKPSTQTPDSPIHPLRSFAEQLSISTPSPTQSLELFSSPQLTETDSMTSDSLSVSPNASSHVSDGEFGRLFTYETTPKSPEQSSSVLPDGQESSKVVKSQAPAQERGASLHLLGRDDRLDDSEETPIPESSSDREFDVDCVELGDHKPLKIALHKKPKPRVIFLSDSEDDDASNLPVVTKVVAAGHKKEPKTYSRRKKNVSNPFLSSDEIDVEMVDPPGAVSDTEVEIMPASVREHSKSWLTRLFFNDVSPKSSARKSGGHHHHHHNRRHRKKVDHGDREREALDIADVQQGVCRLQKSPRCQLYPNNVLAVPALTDDGALHEQAGTSSKSSPLPVEHASSNKSSHALHFAWTKRGAGEKKHNHSKRPGCARHRESPEITVLHNGACRDRKAEPAGNGSVRGATTAANAVRDIPLRSPEGPKHSSHYTSLHRHHHHHHHPCSRAGSQGRRLAQAASDSSLVEALRPSSTLSPDPVLLLQQLESDEMLARMLQAQFDAEADTDRFPHFPAFADYSRPRMAVYSPGRRRNPRRIRSSVQQLPQRSRPPSSALSTRLGLNRDERLTMALNLLSLRLGLLEMNGNNQQEVEAFPFGPPESYFHDFLIDIPSQPESLQTLERPLPSMTDIGLRGFFGEISRQTHPPSNFSPVRTRHGAREALHGARGLRRQHASNSAIHPITLFQENPENEYEMLWQLADHLGQVSRHRLSRRQISCLPTRIYSGKTEGSASDVCHICMSDYEDGDCLRILNCFHEFHSECIDRWIKDNATCPVCRAKVYVAN